MQWFSSDFHLGHKGILKHGKGRPFQTVSEMDDALIENFNKLVTDKDEVYFLGDFAMCTAEAFPEYFQRLNGKWTFILGNHDSKKRVEALSKFGSLKEICNYKEISINKQKFVLNHYPIYSWNGFFRGAIHLHGHSHGTVRFKSKAIDVGVDCHKYHPISYTQVMDIVAKRGKTITAKDDFGELYKSAVMQNLREQMNFTNALMDGINYFKNQGKTTLEIEQIEELLRHNGIERK